MSGRSCRRDMSLLYTFSYLLDIPLRVVKFDHFAIQMSSSTGMGLYECQS